MKKILFGIMILVSTSCFADTYAVIDNELEITKVNKINFTLPVLRKVKKNKLKQLNSLKTQKEYVTSKLTDKIQALRSDIDELNIYIEKAVELRIDKN